MHLDHVQTNALHYQLYLIEADLETEGHIAGKYRPLGSVFRRRTYARASLVAISRLNFSTMWVQCNYSTGGATW